ncbi:phospholipase A1 member A [Aedes albopictus]|uniref:Lipase domain-containing protein n=1 Tax=Aedes albopictus TaxID=7160 RepID=A0ABM2A495_AEDAL
MAHGTITEMIDSVGEYTSKRLIILIATTLHLAHIAHAGPVIVRQPRSDFVVGTCTWVVERPCPDQDIKFYLFTRSNPEDRQYVHIDETLEKSNLSSSYFNPSLPTKVIIHGYNGDMFLEPLIKMKGEYLNRGSYNLFYVDWSVLGPGPCYPSAVHNTKHVGTCIAQLVQRILDIGTDNVHLIGFSLGAQVTNYASVKLRPFKLRRISGLDPAMPLFITADKDDKLDQTDASFVDVIHTNALVQGKIERCGHVDFYMNGGIIQPGCWAGGQNPMACSHHRAPDYFAESIRSLTGFWGWKCESYIYYLLGFCPHNNHQVVAGEDCIVGTEGMFMITTNADSPFAIGRWTDAMGLLKTPNALNKFSLKRDPFISDIDQWGKLEGNFNNVEQLPTPYSQDPNGDDWPYFNHIGTNKLTKDYIKKIIEQDNDRYDESTGDNAAAHLNLLKHAGMSNAINQNEGLSDFRKRLQLKEASVVEQYSSPMYNPF